MTQGTPFLDRCAAALRAYCAARISGAGPPSVVEHWRGLSAVRIIHRTTTTHVARLLLLCGGSVVRFDAYYLGMCVLDRSLSVGVCTLVPLSLSGAVGRLGAGGGRAQDNGVHTRGAAAARLQPKHAPLPLRHGRRCARWIKLRCFGEIYLQCLIF
eukprot:COSAG06_NODE_1365_length_9687_cov_14.601064_2_plen_156_part_00